MSSNVVPMRIGEVHALLRQQFPELELSKIRYYEDQGLVRPARSRKGYRIYSDRDVACLREAIRLAHEEFVPLRIIRIRLIDAGLLEDTTSELANKTAARVQPSSVVSMAVPTPATNTVSIPTSSAATVVPLSPSSPVAEWLSTGQFLAAINGDTDSLRQLQELHVVSPKVMGPDTVYARDDVELAQATLALLARGVDPRMIMQLKRLGERQVTFLDEVTAPLNFPGAEVSPEAAQAIRQEVAGEINAIVAGLTRHAVAMYLKR